MPLPTFEILSLVVVVATLLALARTTPWQTLLAQYFTLAVAAWIGEDLCIRLYQYYAYADGAFMGRAGCHFFIDRVPLLSIVIWPLVILSSRSVVISLWPNAGQLTPLFVGLAVTFDASLIEVIAVRARYWFWADPGHLDVPILGILGWGFFAFGASLTLFRPEKWRYLAALVTGPLVGHALVIASWWGLFRWLPRVDLVPWSFLALWFFSSAITYLVLRAKQLGNGVPWTVNAPRMIATVLFVSLIATTAKTEWLYWLHATAVAVPYLAAAQFKR